MKTSAEPGSAPLSWAGLLLTAAVAVLAFYLAYAATALSFCILPFLFSLYSLRRAETPRKAFYAGLLIGFAMYASQLGFFWNIFGPAAVALWLVLAFWIGLFVLLIQLSARRFPPIAAALLAPFLWTGIEYFRGELYFLRFSWASAGYVFSGTPALHNFAWIGMYGLGFALTLITTTLPLLPKKLFLAFGVGLLAALALITNRPEARSTSDDRETCRVSIAGAQLEFPGPPEIKVSLNKLIDHFPQAELLVLSEYTLDGPVPDWMKEWCRDRKKYLIVGGKSPQPPSQFYNTAFVISPSGEIVFEHAKSVPIQFFNDGLPAPEQKVWHSPWGKIGICVCYDLSYRRVTDAFIRQGAQALIVPTMDVADWGEQQHALHARIAPMRAAEHGIPIFRLASSGISQHVDLTGREIASAPFPGQGQFLFGNLELSKEPRLPLDHVFAPFCVLVTLGLIGLLITRHLYQQGRVATNSPAAPINVNPVQAVL